MKNTNIRPFKLPSWQICKIALNMIDCNFPTGGLKRPKNWTNVKVFGLSDDIREVVNKKTRIFYGQADCQKIVRITNFPKKYNMLVFWPSMEFYGWYINGNKIWWGLKGRVVKLSTLAGGITCHVWIFLLLWWDVTWFWKPKLVVW